MTDQAHGQAASSLLPCPFCGPGQSMVDPWFDDVSKRWAIGCGRCGASSGRSVHAEGSKEAAIAAWNTRPVPAPVGLEREEIAELLWHRFSPSSHLEWKNESHRAEYLDAADAILALSPDHRTEPAVNPSNPDRGEPVAWRWHAPGEVRWQFGAYPPSSDDFIKQPLYAHPPVSAERDGRSSAGQSERTEYQRGYSDGVIEAYRAHEEIRRNEGPHIPVVSDKEARG